MNAFTRALVAAIALFTAGNACAADPWPNKPIRIVSTFAPGGTSDVLSRAIEAGGSSLRDYVQASGELGYFQHHWAVYGKEGEPCPRCDCRTGIRRIVQGGRSTFYCAKRQR